MVVGNQPERETVLDSNQPIEFTTIKDAINAVIGTNYAGWMKACWPNVMGNGAFRLWFPKLAHYENGQYQAAAFGCVNMLSPDWNRLTFDDLKCSDDSDTEYYNGYDLIFAKDSTKEKYIFRGVFIRNTSLSRPNHSVSDRIATRVCLIGTPASKIKLLDQIGEYECLQYQL